MRHLPQENPQTDMNTKTYPPDTEWIAFLYDIREGSPRIMSNRQQHVTGATRADAIQNALKLKVKSPYMETGVAGVSLIPAKEYYELNSGRSWKN